MIWHFCRSVSTLKGRRSGTARHQSSLVIQRVEQSTAVTVNGFTGTYVRMTAIMIRSNRIMHGRCHDNDAAKRGQIVVTQFRQSMTGIPGSGDVQNRSDRPSSFLIFLLVFNVSIERILKQETIYSHPSNRILYSNFSANYENRLQLQTSYQQNSRGNFSPDILTN